MNVTKLVFEAAVSGQRAPEIPPRAACVFLNRYQLAKITDTPVDVIYRRFNAGVIHCDAVDGRNQPLFLMEKLPALKAALLKENSEILA